MIHYFKDLFHNMINPVNCIKKDGRCPKKISISDIGVLSVDTQSLTECCQFQRQMEALAKIKPIIEKRNESKQNNESRNQIRRGIEIPQ